MAERKNKHLVDTCQSMLRAKNVPSIFWAECMKIDAHVIVLKIGDVCKNTQVHVSQLSNKVMSEYRSHEDWCWLNPKI